MTELFLCFIAAIWVGIFIIAFIGIERDLRENDEMLYKEDSKQ